MENEYPLEVLFAEFVAIPSVEKSSVVVRHDFTSEMQVNSSESHSRAAGNP